MQAVAPDGKEGVKSEEIQGENQVTHMVSKHEIEECLRKLVEEYEAKRKHDQ